LSRAPDAADFQALNPADQIAQGHHLPHVTTLQRASATTAILEDDLAVVVIEQVAVLHMVAVEGVSLLAAASFWLQYHFGVGRSYAAHCPILYSDPLDIACEVPACS
jgi:hypothetical protein